MTSKKIKFGNYHCLLPLRTTYTEAGRTGGCRAEQGAGIRVAGLFPRLACRCCRRRRCRQRQQQRQAVENVLAIPIGNSASSRRRSSTSSLICDGGASEQGDGGDGRAGGASELGVATGARRSYERRAASRGRGAGACGPAPGTARETWLAEGSARARLRVTLRVEGSVFWKR